MFEIEIWSQQHFLIMDSIIQMENASKMYYLHRLMGCALSELIQLGCIDSEL